MTRRFLFLPLIVTMLAGAQVPAPDDALKAKLLGVTETFFGAFQKHDLPGMAATLAPDFQYAGSHGVAPKGAVMETLSHCSLASYSLSDVTMMRLTGESVVLLYKVHSSGSCFGQPSPADTINADTFVRRNGKWLIVLTSETALEKV